MNIASTRVSKYRIFIAALSVFAITQLCFLSSAHAQLDFYYGKNSKGFRVGVGPCFSMLKQHYDLNPPSLGFAADIDYAFDPYVSVGVNFQSGTLLGQDASQKQFYYFQSSDKYTFYNLNFKVGVGYFKDFSSQTAFMDAVKRFYVGLGVGQISTNNVLTYNPNVSPSTVYPDINNDLGPDLTKPNGKMQKGSFMAYTLFLGTYIDLPNLWGVDKIELCPNFQFSYVGTPYLDGYLPRANSATFGFFNVTALTVRYKF
jgi:hypothetical protein